MKMIFLSLEAIQKPSQEMSDRFDCIQKQNISLCQKNKQKIKKIFIATLTKVNI